MTDTAERFDAAGEDDRLPQWRLAAPALLAIFVLTRLLVILVAAIVEFAIPLGYQGPTWSSQPILSSLTGSDSIYYLGIAAEGYHLEPVKEGFRDWVFFPLFPIVVRVVSLVVGEIALAGVLAANTMFGVAMVLFYRLSVAHLGRRKALLAVAFLAAAPGGVAFAMAYSESLFMALAIGSLLAAERRQWAVMGILYGLATLTRLPGILVAIPLAVLIVQNTQGRGRLLLGWLLAGPAALAAFYAYLWVLTGEPLAYVTAQVAWNIDPLFGAGGGPATFNPLPYLLIATLLGYTFLLVFIRVDRVKAPYVAIVIVGLLTVSIGGRLQSVARYLVVAWPFAWILASRRPTTTVPILLTGSAGLFVIHAFLHFTQALAP